MLMPAVPAGLGMIIHSKNAVKAAERANNALDLALAASRVPHGFKTAEQFAEFGGKLRSGLAAAGFEGVEALFQGSAVTGAKFTTGAAFDVGRVSDFDIALAGSDLLERATEIGVELRSKGSRTGPLTITQLKELGLFDLQQQLSKLAGRDVKFMIFESA